MTAHTFNWQTEPEGFMKWMLPHILAPLNRSEEEFGRFSEATDNFKRVEITMQINGIETDATVLLDWLERLFDSNVADTAKEKFGDIRFDEISDVIRVAEQEAISVIRRRFEEAGIPIPNEDEY